MKNQLSESALNVGPERERILVQRMKQGNQTALEELIQKYGGKVYYLALQYTRNPQDAEEVLQDVFLKVFRKIDSFRDAERLSPWLYKIAVNTALMKLREQRKRRALVSLEDWMPAGSTDTPENTGFQLADWSPNAENSLIRKETRQLVRSAIEKLPEIYRTVVQLRDVDGFSLGEVSEILAISIPAVKSRLHRGRLIIHKTISRFLAQQEHKRKRLAVH
ncbi:MAG TPA: sigma-70 family RNA polymerase sigma factor [Acidobacteriota bacterium]|nr:sigma-70 family RNA polymerase sigma factor [Acidobacteriota bacterium]